MHFSLDPDQFVLYSMQHRYEVVCRHEVRRETNRLPGGCVMRLSIRIGLALLLTAGLLVVQSAWGQEVTAAIVGLSLIHI